MLTRKTVDIATSYCNTISCYLTELMIMVVWLLVVPTGQ